MTRPATQWRTPTDDVVLHRAVIDHTSKCEQCAARAGGCPIARRLSEMAKVARVIVREQREQQTERVGRAVAVRVGKDTGTPTGPHCRAAELNHETALHIACERPAGKCVCFCHGDGNARTAPLLRGGT